jgi:hypothetical protein
MDYMFVIWEGGQEAETSDRNAVMQEMFGYVGELAGRGRLKGGGPLQGTDRSATVRKRGGQVTATDGPYTETKEIIGGYFLVEADSLEEAVELAKGCPAAAFGGIEVRELIPMG